MFFYLFPFALSVVLVMEGETMGKANEQQKLFVDEYIRDRKRNMTNAAIKAGYSERSAASIASQLLKNPRVIEYMQQQQRSLEEEIRDSFIFDAKIARDEMVKILEKPDARDVDKITVARDFLDRAGFKPQDKIEHSGGIDIATQSAKVEKFLDDLKD